MTKNIKLNQNIPTLRFPGFTDDWIKSTLGKISLRIGDGIHATPKYSDIGEYFFVNGNNLLNNRVITNINTKRVDESEYIKNRRELGINTLLISINGTIGNVSRYKNEKIVLGKSICYINLPETIDSTFIFNFLKLQKTKSYFISELTGSTIGNLSLKSIRDTTISLPTKIEQQKIASFLSAVDSWLDNLRFQKITLESYKKSIIQKIFSQEIRFKDEHGKDYPKWEEKRIGQVLKIGNGKDYKHLATGKIPVFGTGGLMLCVDKALYKGKTVFIGRKGTINKPFYFDGEFWTVDTLFYTHDFVGITAEFTFIVFQNINWLLHNEASGVPSLSKTTIEKIMITLPCLPEQQKIANFLTSIDKSIESKQSQITEAGLWKKGLMQRMFV